MSDNVETIFERHGPNVKAGDIEFTVPRDTSILSLMGGNARYISRIESGCDINPDGWVYYPDGRKFKWFEKVNDLDRGDGGFFVWSPKLKNINEIERLRWRILKYHQKWADKAWKLIEEIHDKGGAFANCTACYKAECYHWFPPSEQEILQIDPVSGAASYKKQKSITLKYHEGYGKSPFNLDLGNRYYKTEHRMMQIAGWIGNINCVLQTALLKYTLPHIATESRAQLKITINNRDYWFHKDYMDHRGKYGWRKLSWPENEVIQITVTNTKET